MAGNKRKKGKKKNQPLGRIGSSLFPRAMLVAVPRSPEPPKRRPEERSPTPVSSALMNATLVGRLIGTPPPSTGTIGTERGPSPPEQDPGPAAAADNPSLDNSMARTSMYDYSEESEEGESEEEEEEDVPDDPRYASLPFSPREGRDRDTLSNRPRLASPMSQQRSDTEQEEEPVQDVSPRRAPYGATRENTPFPRPVLSRTAPVDSGSYTPPEYDRPRPVTEELKAQVNSQASTESDFTEVTNPLDDFSDLITPPPPWKRVPSPKKDVKKGKKAANKKKAKKRREVVEEPVKEERIVPVQSAVDEAVSQSPAVLLQSAPGNMPQNIPTMDEEFFSQLDRLASAKSLQEHEFLRMTNSRLEKELEVVQREREQMLETLKIQGQQMQEERRSSRAGSPQHIDVREDTRQNGCKRRGGAAGSSQQYEINGRLNQVTELCEQLRSENSSIRVANDRLLEENKSLRESLKTPRGAEDDDEGFFVEQLKKQAEDVIVENEDLRNIIHKLNIQLSRYQAKCSPLKKGDPPGRPSRGASPRWLSDTKYLSPLIVAYEDALSDKDKILQQCQEDLDDLKESTEAVVRENQKLHRKLEEIRGTGNGYITPTEWHRLQEQGKLVLEENQVLLERLDINEDKLRSSEKSYKQEVARLKRDLASTEAEKGRVDEELSQLRTQHGGLQAKYERLARESSEKLPVNEHLDIVSDLNRSLDQSQKQHSTEVDNLMTRLKSVQTEKQELAIQLTDSSAENTQLAIQIKALQRAQKKSHQKMSVLQQEVSAALSREEQANLHLNQVLEIAEKTAAERDSYARMAKSQAQEKEKTVNKMMQGNIYVGQMEEKLKLYKHRAQEKLENMSQEMMTQDSNFVSQLRQYEREIKHLKEIIKRKQEQLDLMAQDKRKAEEQLEAVWQSAASDNQRIQAKLNKSLRPNSTLTGLQNGAFGSDSDNKGLLSSDSES